MKVVYDPSMTTCPSETVEGGVMEQMTDIYGVLCDVHAVRQWTNGYQLGVGYDLSAPSRWFVYDRISSVDKWHKHCGPYSTGEQAKDWINEVHRGTH